MDGSQAVRTDTVPRTGPAVRSAPAVRPARSGTAVLAGSPARTDPGLRAVSHPVATVTRTAARPGVTFPAGVPGRPRVLVAGPDGARFATLLRALPQLRPPTVAAGPAALTRIAADAVLLLTDHPVEDVRALTRLPGTTSHLLVLSHSARRQDVVEAMQAGALGYLVHGEFTRAELVRAVFGALAGQSSLTRSASNALVEHLQCRRPAATLGERQQEILRLAALGETNATIAGRLGLSEKTVRNQLSDIYTVLEVRNRTEAVRHWLGQ